MSVSNGYDAYDPGDTALSGSSNAAVSTTSPTGFYGEAVLF